jgi:hypothetical protein
MLATLALAAVTAFAVAAPVHSSGVPQSSAVVLTSITAGEVDPNGVVPTLNGVAGAGTNNWDIPIPLSALDKNSAYSSSATFQDLSYTGNCRVVFKPLQDQGGETVKLAGAEIFSIACTPGLVLLGYCNSQISTKAVPGPATLIGTVFFGSEKSSLKIPMVIQ